MSEKVKHYKESHLNKKKQVEKMFDTISGNYDGLNKVISLGIDKKWRKRVVKYVMQNNPKSVLDIATGTGDLAIHFSEHNISRIVGFDLSEGMLSIARKKVEKKKISEKIEFLQGDSENMPFEDNSFDAITVAFGIRNFENLEKGLTEILRVLKPGGIFVVLETAVPAKFPFKQGYSFYTKNMLPLIGKLFSKDKVAYNYLSESASVFPHGEALNNILRKIGFKEVKNKPQTFGVASIYLASK